MRLLLLLTMMSGFVPVARADALGDAIAVLKSFAATAERDAAAARFAAYGLDAHAPRPVEWSSAAPFDRDVAALAGCKRLDDVERGHILWVLEQVQGRIKGPDGAAARLGLKPSTLYFRMKKLDIVRT